MSFTAQQIISSRVGIPLTPTPQSLKVSLKKIETVMNTLSATLDFPKLIISSGHIDIREDVSKRISDVINNLTIIDSHIDEVMEGWRLKRLPRIDRDIFPARDEPIRRDPIFPWQLAWPAQGQR